MTLRISGMLLAFALMLGLVGCGDESETSSSAPAKVVRKAPQAAAPPVPSAKAPEAEEAAASADDAEEVINTYIAEGKRDPFRAFRFKQPEKLDTPAGPLADFDLAQLVVLGVVWNTKNPRALVSDPEGRSFVLRRGSPIGKNNGRVIRIADDVILVQEKFVDFEGTVSTKDVEMRIRKSQGG